MQDFWHEQIKLHWETRYIVWWIKLSWPKRKISSSSPLISLLRLRLPHCGMCWLHLFHNSCCIPAVALEEFLMVLGLPAVLFGCHEGFKCLKNNPWNSDQYQTVWRSGNKWKICNGDTTAWNLVLTEVETGLPELFSPGGQKLKLNGGTRSKSKHLLYRIVK